MSRSPRAFAALLVLGPAALGCGSAAPRPETRVFVPKAELSLSSARVKIAEPVVLRIAVEHPALTQAKLPPVGSELAGLEVVEVHPVRARSLEPGVALTERQITLRGFRPGAYTVGPMDILVVPAQGAVRTLVAPKASVEIYSVVTGASALADLRPLRGPFELPPQSASWRWFLLTVVAAVACAFAAACALRARSRRGARRQAEAQRPPAHEVALSELRKIRESGILEDGRVSEYTDLVSDVLRRYLEARYALPAPGRTTEEFLDVMAREPVLDRERKKFLAEYLAQCDLVKFAAQEPGRRELEGLFDSSVTFVRETADGPGASAYVAGS
jgi:hypothetical protein